MDIHPKAAALRHRLACRVKAERRERQWSQEALGERANLSQVFISKLENERVAVSIDTLARLAAAFEFDPAHLLSDN